MPLQVGDGGSVCWGLGIFLLGVRQNIVVEASVHSIDLSPGKGVSNRVHFSGDVTDGSAMLRNY